MYACSVGVFFIYLFIYLFGKDQDRAIAQCNIQHNKASNTLCNENMGVHELSSVANIRSRPWVKLKENKRKKIERK